MQITDTQEFTITVEPEDSKGNAVADTLTWTSSDTAVATVSADSTTLVATIVAVAPGTGVTVTAADPSGLTGTLSFDVLGGAVAQLVLTPGTPTEQAPAPAPAS